MDSYQTPLGERYASKQMKYIFSSRNRISTWRQLWVWLAESEQELGLDISPEALSQLRNHVVVEDHEFEIAAAEEKRRRHDVMAHVHTYGIAAPAAAGIIHWGATSWSVLFSFVTRSTYADHHFSSYVTDNADLVGQALIPTSTPSILT